MLQAQWLWRSGRNRGTSGRRQQRSGDPAGPGSALSRTRRSFPPSPLWGLSSRTDGGAGGGGGNLRLHLVLKPLLDFLTCEPLKGRSGGSCSIGWLEKDFICVSEWACACVRLCASLSVPTSVSITHSSDRYQPDRHKDITAQTVPF